MTDSVYTTAQGQKLDMGSLRLKNENTRAVGNMKVNARGDLVDDMNRVISKKTDQVNQQYQKQVINPNQGRK